MKEDIYTPPKAEVTNTETPSDILAIKYGLLASFVFVLSCIIIASFYSATLLFAMDMVKAEAISIEAYGVIKTIGYALFLFANMVLALYIFTTCFKKERVKKATYLFAAIAGLTLGLIGVELLELSGVVHIHALAGIIAIHVVMLKQ